MANTYKNIVITPNIGSATDDPKIQFSGGNTTVNTDITLRVYPTSNGTLSFEGSAGQLFSITNDLTGTIFSVNDISGIPSLEIDANGLIKLAQFGGNVAIGRSNALYKLDVVGTANASNLLANGNMVFTTANDGAGSNLDADLLDGQQGTYYGIATDVSAANRVANAAFLHANAAFANANTVMISAQVAFTHANNAYSVANAANITADLAFIHANNAYAKANATNITADLAFIHANNAYAKANAANITADLAFIHANAAFGRANAALPNTSDVSFNGNLTVPGNFIVGGNIFFDTASAIRIWEPAANVLAFITGSTEDFRVDATGNILIGCVDSTVGNRVKLDVNGAINAAGILVNGSPISSSSSGNIVIGNTISGIFTSRSTQNTINFIPGDNVYINVDNDATNGRANVRISANVWWAPTTSIVTGNSVIAVKDTRYFLTNTSPTIITLPASPTQGDTIYVVVTNQLANNVIARNGNKIMSLNEDLTLDIIYYSIGLTYIDTNLGWVII